MTREEGIILSAYTGYLLVDNFDYVHEFIEKLLGRPVWTHQLADPALQKEIRENCKPILPRVSEEVNRWIPVTERLPEESGCYLVAVKNDHERRYSKTAWYHGNGNWFSKQNVTHWMPLPEAPKEESHETEP